MEHLPEARQHRLARARARARLSRGAAVTLAGSKHGRTRERRRRCAPCRTQETRHTGSGGSVPGGPGGAGGGGGGGGAGGSSTERANNRSSRRTSLRDAGASSPPPAPRATAPQPQRRRARARGGGGGAPAARLCSAAAAAAAPPPERRAPPLPRRAAAGAAPAGSCCAHMPARRLGARATVAELALRQERRVGTLRAAVARACRAALRASAMASAEWSRVTRLTLKARRLMQKGSFASAADKLADALDAARALRRPDCLVVAYLCAQRACMLQLVAESDGLSATAVAAARHEVCSLVTVLPAACMETLERRLTAGTLLPGTCRVEETAWYSDYLLQKGCDGRTADALGPLFGFSSVLGAASAALPFLTLQPAQLAGPQLSEAQCVAVMARVSRFAARAMQLMAQPRPPLLRGMLVAEEVTFTKTWMNVMNMPVFRQKEQEHAHLLASWEALQNSGVLQQRNVDGGIAVSQQHNDDACSEAARRVATHGLRACALAARCGARELHATQFKKCAACQGVVYCCKAHQEADWPAHKAACKAARKAAAAAADA